MSDFTDLLDDYLEAKKEYDAAREDPLGFNADYVFSYIGPRLDSAKDALNNEVKAIKEKML